jgi:hypothetical protein
MKKEDEVTEFPSPMEDRANTVKTPVSKAKHPQSYHGPSVSNTMSLDDMERFWSASDH